MQKDSKKEKEESLFLRNGEIDSESLKQIRDNLMNSDEFKKQPEVIKTLLLENIDKVIENRSLMSEKDVITVKEPKVFGESFKEYSDFLSRALDTTEKLPNNYATITNRSDVTLRDELYKIKAFARRPDSVMLSCVFDRAVDWSKGGDTDAALTISTGCYEKTREGDQLYNNMIFNIIKNYN